MSSPPGLELGCEGILDSQHQFHLYESMFMELVAYHYIRESTVRELSREFGSEWYTSLKECIPAPIAKDGTVCWSQMDRKHPSYHLLSYLEDAMYSDAYFFQDSNDDSIS
jgi:hypothetical protein